MQEKPGERVPIENWRKVLGDKLPRVPQLFFRCRQCFKYEKVQVILGEYGAKLCADCRWKDYQEALSVSRAITSQIQKNREAKRMLGGESLTLILPMPAPPLWPNGRTRRAGFRAMLVGKARKLARQAVEAEQIATAPWKRARLSATFVFKTNRRRDTDNATAALKAYVDGITDALLVDDNAEALVRDEPKLTVDKAAEVQHVELTIQRLTD